MLLKYMLFIQEGAGINTLHILNMLQSDTDASGLKTTL